MNRKPRHLFSKEWTPLRAEIEQVCQKLSIPANDFQPLKITEWKTIDQTIAQKFFARNTCQGNWRLWDELSQESYSLLFKGDFFNHLEWLLTTTEDVYFFTGETINEQTKYWFYQGNIGPITRIIAETHNLGEYFLVSKKYDWLLCYNFYSLIGCGSIVPLMISNKEKFIL
ncbi:hypothetical protein BKI52_07210 [marine bacterium AO1-C]|nr:hypothetical protein BKI52_07210 [marine bacterium AO1-C]